MFTTSKKNKGFTIIESLVAISVLVAAIVGTTKAVQTSLSSYVLSKDQIIAFYLAQEGFEQIRNIRAENGLKNQNWLTGIASVGSDPCYFGKACTVDPINTSAPIINCSGGIGNCPFIRQDTSTGAYSYDAGWPATIFKREIVLTSINADEIGVLVTISWSNGSVTRQFRAKENLFNWQ